MDYLGWRRPLLEYLKNSLEEVTRVDSRTALLLAIVARLPLNPRSGVQEHCKKIAAVLGNDLLNVPWSCLYSEISSSDEKLLSELQCSRCKEIEEEYEEDEKSRRICKKERKYTVTVRDNVFHLDSDGFVVEEKVDLSVVQKVTDNIWKDSTLKLIYFKLIGRPPGCISEFETFAHSLSIFARLLGDGNTYISVLQNLLANIPVSDKNQFTTPWKLTVSLLFKGSINFLYDEFGSANSSFQKSLVESIICCSRKMARHLDVYMNSVDLNFELCYNTHYELHDEVLFLYRQEAYSEGKEQLIHYKKVRCLYMFVHEMITEIITNCSDKTVISGILNCVLSLPDEYFTFIDFELFLATFLSSHVIDNFISLSTSILARKQRITIRRTVVAAPKPVLMTLQTRIRVWQETTLISLLQALSLICRLITRDVELISLLVLKRLKNDLFNLKRKEGNNKETGIWMHCIALAEFIDKHLVGQQAIKFAIRDIILPVVSGTEACETTSNIVCIICQRCIIVGKEAVCTEIATLPYWFVQYVKQYALKFIDAAMDWMATPSELYLHMFRISQIFSSTLQIIVATNTEENMLNHILRRLLSNESLVSSGKFLECLSRILLISTYSSPQFKYSHRSPECTKSFNTFRSLIYVISFALLQKHLKIKRDVASCDVYSIRKMCCMLRHTLFNTQFEGDEKITLFIELNPRMIPLLQLLSGFPVLSDCFQLFLKFYFDLGDANLSATDLRSIFAIAKLEHNSHSALLHAILEYLQQKKVEPRDVYLFPQIASSCMKYRCSRSQYSAKNDSINEKYRIRRFSVPLSHLLIPFGKQVEQLCDHQLLSRSATDLKIDRTYSLSQCCAAELNLNQMLTLNDGLTVSFWLLLLENQRKASYSAAETVYPICSFNISDSCFLLQLSSCSHLLYVSCTMEGKVVRNKRVPWTLKHDEWNHIALSLIRVDSINSMRVWINNRSFTLSAKHKSTNISKKSLFVFGYGSLLQGCAYSKILYGLSSVFGFRGFLKFEHVFILHALGPNFVSLDRCNVDSLTVRLMSLLHYNFINLSSRQSSLLELFADVKAKYIGLTNSFVFNTKDYWVDVQWKSDSQSSSENVEHSHLPPPRKYLLNWRGKMMKRISKSTIDDCLMSLGSHNLLLFFFAQTIDQGHSAHGQAVAFRLLLHFLTRVSPFMANYTVSNMYSCVIRCVTSPLAHLDQLLEVIQVFCISSPFDMNYSKEADKERLIVNSEFLVKFVCTAQIWKGERILLWQKLLGNIAQCISEKSSEYSVFNKQQLRRPNFLKKFVETILEMFQNEESYQVEAEYVSSLTEIAIMVIRDMSETTEEILYLWNFIFLSHAPAHTYIAYGHSDHLAWLQQDLVGDKTECDLSKDIDLVCRLKDYVSILSKDRIIEIWTRERSVRKLREMYEAACFTPAEEIEKSKNLDTSTDSDKLHTVSDLKDVQHKSSEHCNDGASICEAKKDWFSIFRCRCLEHLTTIVQHAPCMFFSHIVNMRLSWKAIISLLTNQRDQLIRNCLFTLLTDILLRAGLELRFDFLKNGGFELLSNQMRGYSVTDEVASALFSLLFEESVCLSDILDSKFVCSSQVNRFKSIALKAIFVLWEESVDHSTLSIYCNVSSVLTMLFSENDMWMQAMMDVGVWVAVVSVLRRIALLHPIETDLVHVSSTTPFMEYWFGIVKKIIRRCVPYRNCDLYEMCLKLLWLSKMAVLTSNNQSEKITRQGLSCILGLWLSVLQELYLNEADSKSASEMLSTEQESAVDVQNMKCPYKSYCNKCIPSVDERAKRIILCVTEISQFFICMPVEYSRTIVTNQEIKLFEIFLSLLSTVTKHKDANSGISLRSGSIQRVISASREGLKYLFGHLISFVLFPASLKEEDWELKKRLMIVRLLVLHKTQLKSFLDSNLEYQCALNLSLHELALLDNVQDLSFQRDVEVLIKFLRSLQIESPLATLNSDRFSSLNMDEWLAVHGYVEHRNKFLTHMRRKAVTYIKDMEEKTKKRNEIAMQITYEVVEDQNMLRKYFMKACRESELKDINTDLFLDQLVTDLSHPEGLCHDPESWPSSWSLDPTEGPNRERRRLMSSHLSFDSKFLQPEVVMKMKNRERSPPLFHLLSSLRRSVHELNLESGLELGERIILSLPAVLVRSAVESNGEIIAGDKKLYFHSDCTRSVQRINLANTLFIRWCYEDLVDICKRHHLLKDIALEIFLANGQTYLIVFQEQKERDQFASQIFSSKLCKLSGFSNFPIHLISQLWREGAITNFEYLMQLNKMAGRSYNDLMQYPVFPFILSDYQSEILDLTDFAAYRDLSRPMAVQDKRLEQHYLHKYKYLAREAAQLIPGRRTPFSIGPYHYGSHYSNIGIVAHYLVRLPPFTDIALEYQDNNFDIADRLFNSVETAWRLASFDSTTDFKELIPEFFYLPDFLINHEKLNLGIRQNGDVVNDVILPRWCQGSPRLFVLIHRQALESVIVSSKLNHWIDLIFGYKQTGKAAIDAINVFHPSTYRINVINNINEGEDELSVSALQTMVQTYGQMPSQLFRSPHISRLYNKEHNCTSNISLSPLDTIKGIRWGEFVGSPATEYGDLVIILNEEQMKSDICGGSIIAFSEGNCFVIPNKTCFIYKHKDKKLGDFCSYGLITWRHSDELLRLRLEQPKLSWNLASYPSYSVVAVAYSFSFDLLLVGISCGIIYSYHIVINDSGVKDFVLLKGLHAHDSPVRALTVCSNFAIGASGCDQGKVCLWDLNRLTYVRTLVSTNEEKVQFICISRSSCDVAVVGHFGYGSNITLYTINGLKVGSTRTEIVVTAVAMTSLREGTTVNCLFLALQNGVIRIYNLWTMGFVRDIVDYRFLEPITSISFSNSCRRLFVNFASGRVVCWQGQNFKCKRLPVLKIVSDK
ncbi:unnamed protein product [Thelazia callipaeda]|uniref:Putative neurobeachin homolog n=1 Tax=Thelazia callipaeda TaxID=103827 RepID=A0A158RBH0_THECL|nr:unnamed protein product [Thelazia callipaeda]